MTKQIACAVTLALLGSIVAMLGVELAVRILPDSILPAAMRSVIEDMNGRRRHRDQYSIDSTLWFVFKPGIRTVVEHPDFTFEMKTNLNLARAGFRGGTLGGPAWGVAVGDSFTFSFGVSQEKSWVALLADEIKGDIINLGVPGWGPQQYTRSLEQFGVTLNPRVVFYGLYQNDLNDGTRFERRDGRFERFSMRVFMTHNSLVYNLFRRLGRTSKTRSYDISLPQVELSFAAETIEQQLDKENRNFEKGWPIAVREIEKAFAASQKINAQFVLLYFPSKEETYWALIRENPAITDEAEKHLASLRKALRELCEARRFLCLDLTPPLEERASRNEKLYFNVDTHLNEAGNRVVEREIRQFLSQKGIL
jgi:hypothetical protein